MTNLLSFLGSGLLIFWNLIKFIFIKIWKFILLIGSLLIGLFTAKKVIKEE